MFLEVKTDPYTIIIQRKTRRGQWENLAEVKAPKRMDYFTVDRLINVYWDGMYEDHIRAVIIGQKSKRVIQVLSSDGADFYRSIAGYQDAYFSVYVKGTGAKMMFTNIENSIFGTMEAFHKFFIDHQGIKKARMRPEDPADAFLKTWDIIFNDGVEISVSFLEAA